MAWCLDKCRYNFTFTLPATTKPIAVFTFALSFEISASLGQRARPSFRGFHVQS